MTTFIDADGHVEESTAMFSRLEEEYYPRRPLPLGFGQDTIYGPNNAVWYLDGRTYPKLVGQGGFRFATPTIMEQAKRKSASIPAQELTELKRGNKVSRDPADYFREGRVYVACEADEDIENVIKSTGEDSLMVASDYPHSDASHEDNVVEAIMRREDLSLQVKEKILSENPNRLYQI